MKNRFEKTYHMWILSIVITPLLFLGCAKVGHDFDSTKVQIIKVDTTTQNEIINMFGKPWREGIEDGVKTWTYGQYTYRLIGNADTKDLVIKFHEDGRVKSYNYSKTVER